MAKSFPEKGISVIVPSGALGNGVLVEHLEMGVAAGGKAIAVDAGSTDSGPAYLARGSSKWPKESSSAISKLTRNSVGAKYGIPVLIGSCGTSGCDDATAWTRDIAIETAGEQGLTPKIAVLYSEQDPKKLLKQRNKEGKVHALPPLGALTDETIDKCKHIVALMGPEPYIEALKQGADIVLGGRTTDTAVMGAFALMHGAGLGPTWHAAKTVECGGVCTTKRGQGGVIYTAFEDHFEVEPLSPTNTCDVNSISAHMLYENSDPFVLTEPGGVLNVTKAEYTQMNDRRVAVYGSVWHPKPYTMKLEGAGPGPYQTISLVGIADPKVLDKLDLFHDRLMAEFTKRIDKNFPKEIGHYNISIRIYGWNAVTGRKMPADTAAPPHEVGVMLVITARTQELATRMSQALNPILFHYPALDEYAQPSYGFAFTPQEIGEGPDLRLLPQPRHRDEELL